MEPHQIIKERLLEAPVQIKAIILENELSNIIEKLGAENSLSEEQQDSLENETIFVLLGMETLSNLSLNIQNSLAIETGVANLIYEEIYSSIIKNIENLLPTEVEEGSTEIQKAQDIHPVIEEGEVAHDTPGTNIIKEKEESEGPLKNERQEHIDNMMSGGSPHTREELGEESTQTEIPKSAEKPANSKDNLRPDEVSSKISYPQGQDPYREPIE